MFQIEDNRVPRPGESRFRHFLRRLVTRKPIEFLLHEGRQTFLKRTLNAFQLTCLGIGCIIGTGIFVLTGIAASKHAGPALIISFVIAGLAASTAALVYSELSSMINVSGSSYTYTYTAVGEFPAWIVAWALLLEYIVSSAAVAVGWTAYLNKLIHSAFNKQLPMSISTTPLAYGTIPGSTNKGFYKVEGADLNLFSVLIVVVLSIVLVVGVQESATVNFILVIIKVLVVLIFIFGAAKYVNRSNYSPFVPPVTSDGRYGVAGIFKGAQQVFFAYIGFDAVSTAAQEAKNPARDVPIGALASLFICTALYIAMTTVLLGVGNYKIYENSAAPVVTAIEGFPELKWLQILVSIGALAGLTSVILTLMLAQPRIFFSMSRDGLIPPIMSKVHPRFKTPIVSTLSSTVVISIMAAFLPIDVLADLTSTGTLFAFIGANASILILRRSHPHIPRVFKCPFVWVVAGFGTAVCVALIALSGPDTLIRFVIWMAIGITIYAVYGYWHSKVNNHPEYFEIYEDSEYETEKSQFVA